VTSFGTISISLTLYSYWHDPGAFANGFKGFCSVFVTAAFAYGGTELAGLAAAEAEDPASTLPKACRQVFWRIFFFYGKPLNLLQKTKSNLISQLSISSWLA